MEIIMTITHPTAIVDSVVTGRPLAERLVLLTSRAEAADRAWRADDSCAADDESHPSRIATEAADRERDAALAALAASDEPRDWQLVEDGYHYDTVEAPSLAAALQIARVAVDHDSYDPDAGTLWVDVQVKCLLTGEEDSDTVAAHPDAPSCASGHAHDWQSPWGVLGGDERNPGVWGHGGGVVIREVCAHCGTYRVTDTWAQRPDTGEQGLTSVEYLPPDDASRAWVES